MEQIDKFLEKKNELFEKGKEKGYVSVEELMELIRRFKLDGNQQKELWDEIEKAPFDFLPAYKIKAKEIKNKQDRIAYCYYICFNKLLYGKTNFDEYTRVKARKLIKAVDAILNGLNNLERDVIETYFGLRTGELLENDQDTIKALGNVCVDQYIDVKNSAFDKIDKPFLKMVAQDEKSPIIESLTLLLAQRNVCCLHHLMKRTNKFVGQLFCKKKEKMVQRISAILDLLVKWIIHFLYTI